MTVSGSDVYDETFKGPLIALSGTNPADSKTASYKEIIFYNEKVDKDKGNLLRVMSWNLLAPPYYRKGESYEEWKKRITSQICSVKESNADVIGLQEFWTKNDEYLKLWRSFASANGYSMFISPRTGDKADGCCMLVRLSEASVETLSYNDWGNRVVQVVTGKYGDHDVLLAQTHLTFPHSTPHDGPMRLNQGRKLGQFLKKLNIRNIIVFGDMNSRNGVTDPAVKNIVTYGELKHYGPVGSVSHLAHNGDKMECDLVFTSGCKIFDIWLAESEEDLLARKLLSDHRPCHAIISLSKSVSECSHTVVTHDDRKTSIINNEIPLNVTLEHNVNTNCSRQASDSIHSLDDNKESLIRRENPTNVDLENSGKTIRNRPPKDNSKFNFFGTCW